jgi:hypothetical protein
MRADLRSVTRQPMPNIAAAPANDAHGQQREERYAAISLRAYTLARCADADGAACQTSSFYVFAFMPSRHIDIF